jgi:hypothetical protein
MQILLFGGCVQIAIHSLGYLTALQQHAREVAS